MAIDKGRLTITPAQRPALDERITVVTPVENNTLIVNIGQVTRTPTRLTDLLDVNMGTGDDGGLLEWSRSDEQFNLKRDPGRLILDGGNF